MEEKVIQTLSRQRDSGTIVELVENEAGFRFVVKRVQNLEAPIYRAIFQKETQALTRLKACENIVRIFRSDIQAAPDGRSEGIISMEYVQGRPLSQMLDVIPNASTRYNLVKQLTNAIQHAHRNSVIHRDINPSNILITDSFELKLIDFGIAKIRGMFQDGTTYQFATQNYSAPEVTVHSENATERSDIYSLGAVIYFLFTGEVPVTATEMPTAIQSAGGIDVKLRRNGSASAQPFLRTFILAHGLFNLQIAVSELDPDCFLIDYSDPFNHLANDPVIILLEATEVFLQVSC